VAHPRSTGKGTNRAPGSRVVVPRPLDSEAFVFMPRPVGKPARSASTVPFTMPPVRAEADMVEAGTSAETAMAPLSSGKENSWKCGMPKSGMSSSRIRAVTRDAFGPRPASGGKLPGIARPAAALRARTSRAVSESKAPEHEMTRARDGGEG